MNVKRPINKNNPKNIYCDHCEHFKQCGKTFYGVAVYRCENPASPKFNLERNYWNRCKSFVWNSDLAYYTK
jgi:hypothetical protein